MKRRLTIKMAETKENPENYWISTGVDMEQSIDFAHDFKRKGILIDIYGFWN